MAPHVLATNLGTSFDLSNSTSIELKAGTGITIPAGGQIEADLSVIPNQSVTFENGFVATTNITVGQDVNDTQQILMTADRSDTGWNTATNASTYTGSPDHVIIYVIIPMTIPQGASIQRPAPVLELRKNGTLFTEAKTGYIRDISDHEESSNTIAVIDGAPGNNPVYTLFSRQESNSGGLVTAMAGSIGSFKAIEKQTVTVLTT